MPTSLIIQEHASNPTIQLPSTARPTTISLVTSSNKDALLAANAPLALEISITFEPEQEGPRNSKIIPLSIKSAIHTETGSYIPEQTILLPSTGSITIQDTHKGENAIYNIGPASFLFTIHYNRLPVIHAISPDATLEGESIAHAITANLRTMTNGIQSKIQEIQIAHLIVAQLNLAALPGLFARRTEEDNDLYFEEIAAPSDSDHEIPALDTPPVLLNQNCYTLRLPKHERTDAQSSTAYSFAHLTLATQGPTTKSEIQFTQLRQKILHYARRKTHDPQDSDEQQIINAMIIPTLVRHFDNNHGEQTEEIVKIEPLKSHVFYNQKKDIYTFSIDNIRLAIPKNPQSGPAYAVPEEQDDFETSGILDDMLMTFNAPMREILDSPDELIRTIHMIGAMLLTARYPGIFAPRPEEAARVFVRHIERTSIPPHQMQQSGHGRDGAHTIHSDSHQYS